MRLAILGHGDKNYLATQKTAAPNLPQFIFKLSSSLAKDGIDLLNTEAKAAIYNIRVMSGTKGDAVVFRVGASEVVLAVNFEDPRICAPRTSNPSKASTRAMKWSEA